MNETQNDCFNLLLLHVEGCLLARERIKIANEHQAYSAPPLTAAIDQDQCTSPKILGNGLTQAGNRRPPCKLRTPEFAGLLTADGANTLVENLPLCNGRFALFSQFNFGVVSPVALGCVSAYNRHVMHSEIFWPSLAHSSSLPSSEPYRFPSWWSIKR